MRWMVLALSLGATIVSLIHGGLAIFRLASGDGSIVIGGSPFTWVTDILLLASSVIALIGGILAFNRRKIGGVFLIVAALLCIFAHPSTRNYGYVFLAGGALSFFVRNISEYDYEDDEYDEDDDNYAEDDIEEETRRGERTIFGARPSGGKRENSEEISYGGKRKERASRMNLGREEYSLGGESGSKSGRRDGEPMRGEPLRIRSAKVCPACGASVGIEHKFCHTCGAVLHGSRLSQELRAEDVEAPVSSESLSYTPERDDLLLSTEDKVYVKPADKYEGDFEEESLEDGIPENTSHHRVFVKPSDDGEEVFKAPLTINPDNSYTEFSKYARRRKRKRNSWTRRILGLLVLFLAVSGAIYLLLGMRKVPEPVPPATDVPPIQELTPVPVAQEPTIWELQQAQIENPTRGVVTGSSVNVRQSNSTAAQVVTRLNSGAAAEFIERREGTPGAMPLPWFHIRIPSNGRDGWIYGQYFQPLDGRQATLPNGYTDALLKSFGAGRADLTAQLGQPTSQTPTTMTWTGLTAEVRVEAEVTRLQITGAQHVLQNGLAVGIDEDILYRTVGYPSELRSSQLRYIESGELGMSVRLQNGRVQSITVGNI